MIQDWGYLFLCMFGKLMNVRYCKKIFLLPSTDEKSEEMSAYVSKLLKVRMDGCMDRCLPACLHE